MNRKWEVNWQRNKTSNWKRTEVKSQEQAESTAKMMADKMGCLNVNWQANTSSNETRPCWVVRNGVKK